MEGVGCTSPQPFDENSYCYQFLDRDEEKWCESEEDKWSAIDVWEDFMKELDAEGHQVMKKFASKGEENVPFEQMLRDTWHHFRGTPASHMLQEKIARKMGRERDGGSVMRERGVDLEEELKIQRFKIKTVNVAGSGVVEEGREN